VFGADGESIPITALAMPIRVLCAPPADHGRDHWSAGGPRCRCVLGLAARARRLAGGRPDWLAGWAHDSRVPVSVHRSGGICRP